MTSTLNAERSFFAASTLLFVATVATTLVWSASMSAMGDMRMPGGWSMSMMWMRMPGSTWASTMVSFLVMWTVMMVAMMLPSLVPMLYRYRHAVVPTNAARLGHLTGLVAGGYFFVWTMIGLAAFPLCVAVAAILMGQPALASAVPAAVGGVVLIAGVLQFTAWKSRHLACCRERPCQTLLPDSRSAWGHGIRLGFHCSQCCSGLIAILLVIGVMNLTAMAVVAAAITIERLAPGGNRVAHATGVILVGAGLFLIALS